ncbi:MAG: DHHA1 domain-containing protein [Patescibacteria group bacterium]
MKKIIVLYHKNCFDGFGGAWAAWKKFGSQAEYIGMKHGNTLPSAVLKNKIIYFIDFVFPLALMKKIIKKAEKVVIIDHHITAKENVELVDDYLFDINHSGAVLAWKYFHPKKAIPRLLLHIEDLDIWKWKLPATAEIISFLSLYDFDFSVWSRMVEKIGKNEERKKIVRDGKIMIKYRDSIVKKIVKEAEEIHFEGRNIFAVNSSDRTLVSYVGNELAKKHPPFSVSWFSRSGKLFVSLRSVKGFDVSKIAKKYGGGGHKAAAGFCLDLKANFPWKITK